MDKMRLFIFIFLLTALLALPVQAAFRVGDNGPRVGGFFEVAGGVKLGDGKTKNDDYNLLEQRLQLETSIYPRFADILQQWRAAIDFRADFLVDEYDSVSTDFQLRQFSLLISPFSFLDLEAGRQVFTWGIGDYLFVNDLFPKDYASFYLGRDDEYLKAPSDGVRLSFYTKPANLDLVLIPFFQPNQLFNGDRLSFYNYFQGRIAGSNSQQHLKEPSNQLSNTEVAARVYRYLGRYEVALYFFRGFYKSPKGFYNEAQRTLFYPRLNAYGVSLRGPWARGIANVEAAYYSSVQDTSGSNRLIPNDMVKILTGYKKDLGNDLTIGLQYYYQQRLDYDNYRQSLLAADITKDRRRHLVTFRITKLFKNQTIRTDLFTFFSPSDNDLYLRPAFSYDFTDQIKITLGANLSWGEKDYTEFGQMEGNKNIYLRLRYSF
jgi:hypothetical protein